jgi:hypothetical protein
MKVAPLFVVTFPVQCSLSLEDSLSGDRRQLRLRVCPGVSGQGSVDRRHAVRRQPSRQSAVHANLLGPEERATGGVVVVVWATIIWCAVAVWPRRRRVTLAQGSYFVWVSIATVLQLSITAINWGRG